MLQFLLNNLSEPAREVFHQMLIREAECGRVQIPGTSSQAPTVGPLRSKRKRAAAIVTVIRHTFTALLLAAATLRAAECSTTAPDWVKPLEWVGDGGEYSVPNAPPGYEYMHYCTACSATPTLANGTYLLVLQFIEPVANAAGTRIFDVIVNDQVLLSSMDIFARVGGMVPLERGFLVVVRDGRLRIELKGKVGTARLSHAHVCQVGLP